MWSTISVLLIVGWTVIGYLICNAMIWWAIILFTLMSDVPTWILQVVQRFQELFAQTKYKEAAELAAESPQGILRTPDTVAKFQVSILLLYYLHMFLSLSSSSLFTWSVLDVFHMYLIFVFSILLVSSFWYAVWCVLVVLVLGCLIYLSVL